MELLPYEPGFTLSSTGVVCDTSDGTVTKNKTNWIGVYNNTLPALASTCPLDYCNTTINKLSVSLGTCAVEGVLAFFVVIVMITIV